MLKCIIFDVDGTIADTLPLCIKSFRNSIEKISGKPCSDEEIIATFGPSEEGTMMALIPDRYEEGVSGYLSNYKKYHKQMCPDVFPGIRELFKFIKKNNLLTGLVTGKGRKSLDISLELFGCDGWFDAIEAGNPQGENKAECMMRILKTLNLKPDEAIYVGDTVTDINACKKAGIPIISAAWAKTADFDALSKLNPDRIYTRIEDFADWLSKKIWLDKTEEYDIIGLNSDVWHKVYAACDYKRNLTIDKNFSLLLLSDVHGGDDLNWMSAVNNSTIPNAVKVLNNIDCIDAGVVLGDISARDALSGWNWYCDSIKSAKKPFLTVVGNHDAGNSSDVAFAASNETLKKGFLPAITPFVDTQKLYYKMDFDKYKIRMIILFSYEYKDEISKDDPTKYAAKHGDMKYSNEQIDWFIDTLSDTPKDYSVIVCRHTCPPCVIIDNGFSEISFAQTHDSVGSHDAENLGTTDYCGYVIEDIINAWKNGAEISETYKCSQESDSDIVVNADFKNRGKGDFICHLGGQYHADILAKSKKYPDQLVYFHETSGHDRWTIQYSNIPRVEGTKSQECMTVLSVNKQFRTVNLVRIGACITNQLKDKSLFSFKY